MKTGDFSDVADEDLALLGNSEPPETQLGQALTNPWPALVNGVCELVDELIVNDPADERIKLLVSQLWLSLVRHRELVPVEFFQTWVAQPHVFDDEARANLYDCMAAVCPDWIVEHALSDAVGTSMVARASSFWERVGTAYPGLLLQFAGGWFKSVEWDQESMWRIKPAFVEAAKKYPQEIAAMIELLEEHRGAPPGPDIIDFRHIEFSSLLETLRKIKDEQES
jgi:hypothetical protein